MAVNFRFLKIEIASEKHRIGLGVHLKVFVHHNKQSQHKFTIRETVFYWNNTKQRNFTWQNEKMQ